MKRYWVLLLGLIVFAQPVFADFKEHFDLGTQYLSNYQYSNAISEFKSALHINYKDNSARIQIINAYLARGTHFANSEKNWAKAADDYRSALFYMQIYPDKEKAQIASIYDQVNQNLNTCLNMLKFDRSPVSRYAKAKELRADGNFSAAAYEFSQSLGEKSQIKDSYQQIGDVLKILGNEAKAAEYYRKAISVDPTDITLRLTYANLLDKLGSEDAAVEEYNYILTKSGTNKEVILALEKIYKRKLDLNPNDADLNANLGAILQKQEKYDEALEHYKKAEQLSPSNITTRINVGTLYQQKGDYKTAIIAYDSVLILEPDNINANLYKAQCKAALGDDKTAQDLYKKVLSLDPGNNIAVQEMFNSAKNTLSVKAFIDYVEKNSNGIDTVAVLYPYALDLHKSEKFQDAITVYEYLIEKGKDTTGEMALNLAIATSQLKNYDEAMNILVSAQKKFPDNTLIKSAISDITETIRNNTLDNAAELYKNKEYKKAIEEYLKIDPPTADMMLTIASAYQNLGDNTNALIYYKNALQLKPDNADIAYYIASIYAETEDYDSAEAYAQKALIINKDHRDSIALLKEIKEQNSSKLLEAAVQLFDEQKYEQSLPLLSQLISDEPKNAYALYYRGMVYDAQQKYNDAINDYKKALSINPDELKVANYLIAVDYDNMEKYKEAYTYYDKYASLDVPDDEYKTYSVDRSKELKNYVEQTTKPVSNKQ